MGIFPPLRLREAHLMIDMTDTNNETFLTRLELLRTVGDDKTHMVARRGSNLGK
jgi:hypothetical protein